MTKQLGTHNLDFQLEGTTNAQELTACPRYRAFSFSESEIQNDELTNRYNKLYKRSDRMDDNEKEYIPHDLMQFFSYEHLPDHLKKVSKEFCILATGIDRTLPPNPEKTTALRKLVEAKDCAVRAVIHKPTLQEQMRY